MARFLQEHAIETVAVGEEHEAVALDAYCRFGNSRHPAAFHIGDCCTYATASIAGERLLCMGDDFRWTDLRLVGFCQRDDTR